MKNHLYHKPLSAIVLISALVITGCSRGKISVEIEKRDIELVIRSSISWAADKNLSLLYSAIADDPDYLEVHPNARVVKGIDEFRKSEEFWMDPRFRAVRYEISDLKISISRSGSVAWWFCMLDDINEWDGKPASWENARWTGVLEKRNGKWVIVQMHFSFASQ